MDWIVDKPTLESQVAINDRICAIQKRCLLNLNGVEQKLLDQEVKDIRLLADAIDELECSDDPLAMLKIYELDGQPQEDMYFLGRGVAFILYKVDVARKYMIATKIDTIL